MTIEEFGRLLRSRELTALDFTRACLRRIDELQPHLNAFIRVLSDEACREAEKADRELAGGHDRGPLHGVPIAVKDLIDIAGVPTTAASRVREKHIAAADAPVITRLRDAGAVIIGKTNLDEFAFGTTSENSAFGGVRHPLDAARSPGGSSGGSAVAVATGMALAALGSDTGGSIRIPAAACGIVGLKPALGEVPIDGVVPLSSTFDHLGPFARTVGDVAVVQRALAELSGVTPAVERPRFGVPRPYFCDLLDGDVRQRFDAAVTRLRTEGAAVEDVAIPHASDTPAVYVHIHSTEGAAYHAKTLDAVPDLYTPLVRRRLEVGRYVMAQDYVRAMQGRALLRGEVDAALDGLDALLLPTLPIPAPPIGAESVPVEGVMQPVRAMMLRLTQLFNVTGHPAISIPCGTTPAGLPCGLQIVARRTDALLSLAEIVERAISSSDRPRDSRR